MKLFPAVSISWRKTLLVLAAVSVLIYAVAVLAYVPWTPDLGFRCAFSPVVKRVYLPENAGYPASEDHIIQVGNYRFPGKDQPQFWAQVQLLRKLIAFR